MVLTGDAIRVAVPNWCSGAGPVYVKLAGALRRAIQSGELPAGAKLPSERQLALCLAASRSTIVAAYKLLTDEGVVSRRQGSGTWISTDTIQGGGYVNDLINPRWTQTRARSLVYSAHVAHDLCIPHLAPCADLIERAYREAAVDVASHVTNFQYEPQGLPAMRRAVADYLCDSGIPTTDDQIMITGGSQQGISLLAAALLSPGDRVLVESPTWLGAIDAFNSVGAQLVSVPSDELRSDPSMLTEIIERTQPRILFIMPTCQSITGMVMSDEVRRAIAHHSDLSDVVVIEDNIMSDFVYVNSPRPPVAAYGGRGNLLTLGSLSKVFWVGLRVGWMRMPHRLASGLVRFKATADLGSSMVVQAVATRLLQWLPEAREAWKSELTQCLDAAEEALSRYLPAWDWERPEAGWSLWIQLPFGDAREFSQVAQHHGVRLTPGPMVCADDGYSDHVRMVFAQPIPELLEGIKRLGVAWDAYESSMAHRSLGTTVV